MYDPTVTSALHRRVLIGFCIVNDGEDVENEGWGELLKELMTLGSEADEGGIGVTEINEGASGEVLELDPARRGS